MAPPERLQAIRDDKKTMGTLVSILTESYLKLVDSSGESDQKETDTGDQVWLISEGEWL